MVLGEKHGTNYLPYTKNPRVSLETLFDAILQQHPRSEEKSFRKFSTLTELQEFVKTITEFDMCI